MVLKKKEIQKQNGSGFKIQLKPIDNESNKENDNEVAMANSFESSFENYGERLKPIFISRERQDFIIKTKKAKPTFYINLNNSEIK